MINLPWKTKGILLCDPRPNEIDLLQELIEKILAPGGCNLIVLRVCYAYRFTSHPECISRYMPLSLKHVRRLADTCEKNGIRLIPLINLLGHQSPVYRATLYKNNYCSGLLNGYPEFDETPHLKDHEIKHTRALCPSHPDIKPIVFDLMDEIIDAFRTDALHVGLDEVIEFGKCERCKDKPKDQLLADWANALADHVKKSHNAQVLMWGDRMLNAETTYGNAYESNAGSYDSVINLINKDNLICDWHYDEGRVEYPSVDVFANNGYKMLICPRLRNNCENFINYAKEHDRGHIEGVLLTTWDDCGQIAGHMLRDPDDYTGRRYRETLYKEEAQTIEWFFQK